MMSWGQNMQSCRYLIALMIFTPAMYELAEVGSKTSLSQTRFHSVTTVSVNTLLSYIHPLQDVLLSLNDLLGHENLS